MLIERDKCRPSSRSLGMSCRSYTGRAAPVLKLTAKAARVGHVNRPAEWNSRARNRPRRVLADDKNRSEPRSKVSFLNKRCWQPKATWEDGTVRHVTKEEQLNVGGRIRPVCHVSKGGPLNVGPEAVISALRSPSPMPAWAMWWDLVYKKTTT